MMKKKEWVRPLLIVLTRTTGDIIILAKCKVEGEAGPANSDRGCVTTQFYCYPDGYMWCDYSSASATCQGAAVDPASGKNCNFDPNNCACGVGWMSGRGFRGDCYCKNCGTS